MNNVDIDRAMWRRFGTTNKDRCIVCGNTAIVTVSLTAHERNMKGERGAPMLTKQSFVFCDTHGQARFGEALRRLNGAVELKDK